jgi:hypothetical protein
MYGRGRPYDNRATTSASTNHSPGLSANEVPGVYRFRLQRFCRPYGAGISNHMANPVFLLRSPRRTQGPPWANFFAPSGSVCVGPETHATAGQETGGTTAMETGGTFYAYSSLSLFVSAGGFSGVVRGLVMSSR